MATGRPDGRADGLADGPVQRVESVAPPAAMASELQTFLVADIRGYTQFTAERGDEAAARLTGKFATIVREFVTDFGGTLFELRGDEALCVLSSPRQTLRLAVALQRRFVDETAAQADLPLLVGIGIDAGETVRGVDGYRGGALNLAARLCGLARPGEILASPEVTHLARTVAGIRYVVLDGAALKGLTEPVTPVRIVPDGEDPARRIAELLPRPVRVKRPAGERRRPSHPVAVLAGIAVLGAGVALAVATDRRGDGRPSFAENSLAVLDPHSGRLLRQVPIGVRPTAVAVAFGSVWITSADAGSVTRVDEASLSVSDTIKVGTAPTAISAGRDAMWVVSSGSGTVSRIDPADDDPQTIRVGVAPSAVVESNGSVWVTNSADGTVSRVDPSLAREVERIPVGSGPSGISAGRDIWVTNWASDTVSVLDPTRRTPTRTIHVGAGPRGIAVSGDTVWVACSGGSALARISAAAGSLTELLPVGRGPGGVVSAGGDVWTALDGSAAIARLEPQHGRSVHTFPLGPTPGGLAAADGKLWVVTTSDPAAHRGGTLRLVGPRQGIDPDWAFSNDENSRESMSFDGLVAFGHGGGEGLTIVPDLAEAIPVPSGGGRFYSFRLRSGIRWSNGRPVTIDDVRFGIERAVASPSAQGAGLKGLLVGADRCTPAACSIPGITLDSGTRTITIETVRASGNLLDLLVGAVAIPVGTPLADQETQPIPATGPYRIARHVRDEVVELSRNPYFREWSAAAQPAGYPDRIEYRMVPDDGARGAIDAVTASRADWANALDGGTDLAAYSLDVLRARFGSRLYVGTTQNLWGIFLNTRVPPFDDVRVRRALSFAMDRRSFVADWNAPGDMACQFGPPDYPGYRPYCPYTSGEPGTWQGADVARGVALVKGLHPERTKVVVWANPSTAASVRHVVEALAALGFPARMKVVTGHYLADVLDSRRRVQAGFFGWLTFDASATNAFGLYRCETFVPGNPRANINPAGFCDPALDERMARAERMQAASPAAANELWAGVDRDLVDAAPWLPLVNAWSVDVVSERVRDFKRSPALGVLFDQMWVR